MLVFAWCRFLEMLWGLGEPGWTTLTSLPSLSCNSQKWERRLVLKDSLSSKLHTCLLTPMPELGVRRLLLKVHWSQNCMMCFLYVFQFKSSCSFKVHLMYVWLISKVSWFNLCIERRFEFTQLERCCLSFVALRWSRPGSTTSCLIEHDDSQHWLKGVESYLPLDKLFHCIISTFFTIAVMGTYYFVHPSFFVQSVP